MRLNRFSHGTQAKRMVRVIVWYDTAEKKWFMDGVLPNVTTLLKERGFRTDVRLCSLKRKHDLNTYGDHLIQDIKHYRNPDILLRINGVPVIGIERSKQAPTGANAHKRFPILFACCKLGIPSILYCPLKTTRRKRPHNDWLDTRICEVSYIISRQEEVPIVVFMSKNYTEFDERIDDEKTHELCSNFLNSDRLFEDYVLERVKVAIPIIVGEKPIKYLRKFTSLDNRFLSQMKEYVKLRKKYRREEPTIIRYKDKIEMIYCCLPEGTWEGRGTGLLESEDGKILLYRELEHKPIVYILPHISQDFYWIKENPSSIRWRLCKEFSKTVRFQEDLTREDFERFGPSIKRLYRLAPDELKLKPFKEVVFDVLDADSLELELSKQRHEKVKKEVREVILKSDFILIHLGAEEWLGGIPDVLWEVPKHSEIFLPRISKNMWFFKSNSEDWRNFLEEKKPKEVYFQQDMRPEHCHAFFIYEYYA